MSEAVLERLRAELAERSVCEAIGCPSWGRLATWLRGHGHADIGDWLDLELAGLRRSGDRARLVSVAERALASRDPSVRALWLGESRWSLWFGPFVLAIIGSGEPGLSELLDALGPHALLLARERVWIGGDPHRWHLAELERGSALLLAQTLPGAFEPTVEHLRAELRDEVGELALGNDDVQWRTYFGQREPPNQPPEGWAVLGCRSAKELGSLHQPSVRALEAVAVVAPPELLSRWPEGGRVEPCFAPLPSFARRYAQLGAAQPALIGQLRAELAARPLSAAHRCPSWIVVLDWLLEHGDELLAEWLRYDLGVYASAKPSRLERRKLSKFGTSLESGELAPIQPDRARRLGQLWRARDESSAARSIWLGPFMLAYIDPQLDGRCGADELQATLGRHATLLARERIYTTLDHAWIDAALRPRGVPVLAPTPAPMTERFAAVLLDHAEQAREANRIRVIRPGVQLEPQRFANFETNFGPVPPDSEAIALLCCDSVQDLSRHAAEWAHLETFEHVVILGTAKLLERWPHPGERIEPWGAAAKTGPRA